MTRVSARSLTMVGSLLLSVWPFGVLRGQVDQAPLREHFIITGGVSVEKRLATVSEYVRQERWDAATELLRDVRGLEAGAIVRVDRHCSVALAHYCDIMLTRLPPAGLEVYRASVDPRARALLEEYRAAGDPRPLESIFDQLVASSVGDEAIDLLAERAWERGEIDRARDYWSLLIPTVPDAGDERADPPVILRYPDADLDPAAVRARLVMCEIALGNAVRAGRRLEAFGELHPDATGSLAGRTGNYTEILTELWDERGWEARPEPHGTSTLGSHPSRDGALVFDVAIGLPDWGRPLPQGRFATKPGRPALPTAPPLAYHPAIWRDKVFVASSEAIWGFEQANGAPAWSSGAKTSPRLYPPGLDAVEPLEDPPDQPHSPRTGVPRYSLTIAGDRLFARLGPPITNWPERVELRRKETNIVCLDLESQGRLDWTISGDDLDATSERWSFEGPPVALDGALYLLATRSRPRPTLQIVCLEADSGAVRWQRPLGTPLNLPPPGVAVMSHRLIAVAAGRLYVPTDQGALICASADDGAILWVGWYESASRAAPPPANLADRGLPAGCLVSGGVVVTAPNDSNAIFGFDAFSGRLLWRRTIRGGAKQLLGARDATLVVAGERLHGLDLATGRPRWTIGFEDPPGFGAGRGLLGARRAYWPTREDLLVVDWRTGRLARRIPLHDLFGLTGGGNLAASPGGLFMAGPGRLIGFRSKAR